MAKNDKKLSKKERKAAKASRKRQRSEKIGTRGHRRRAIGRRRCRGLWLRVMGWYQYSHHGLGHCMRKHRFVIGLKHNNVPELKATINARVRLAAGPISRARRLTGRWRGRLCIVLWASAVMAWKPYVGLNSKDVSEASRIW
ncbi:hypothetical protein HYE68_000280 [Fusarium pseudograminearum]|nr:hypothetical protein HYE68_000280 [Fusarium pseudograminearum]